MAHDSDIDGRIQRVLEALIRRRIEESLERVDDALHSWRRDEIDALEVHGEIVRHTARTTALSARVARGSIEGFESLLRSALDAGVLDVPEFTKLTQKRPQDIPSPPSLDEEITTGAGIDLPEKRVVADKLLTDGPVLLHLDTRRDGVEVPVEYASDARMVLRVGHGLKPPIPDLAVDDACVRATLTFHGRPFKCVLPWSAIYAVLSEDNRGMLWPEDVPPEAAQDFVRATRPMDKRGDRSLPQESTKAGRGHLRLVD